MQDRDKTNQKEERKGLNRRQLLGGAAALGALAASQAVSAGVHTGSDELVVNGLDTSSPWDGFIDLLETGGVDVVHKSVSGMESVGQILQLIDRNSDRMELARSVADIHAAKKAGKIAMIMGCQEANYLERLYQKRPFETYDAMHSVLRAYAEIGVKVQGICYNVSNVFGGGNMDHDVPLTKAGERLVEAIHSNQLVLDVGGHTAEQTSFDAIEISEGVPVVCTHTNMASMNPNMRAISDKLAEAIAGTGGVIGLSAISDFLIRHPGVMDEYPERSPQASVDVLVDQYDYLKQLVGIDHVGLGPDFIWGWSPYLPHNPGDDMVFPVESLGHGVAQTTKGFEDISELPNLVNKLRERGWTNTELDKMLGGNWMRVYKEVWGA